MHRSFLAACIAITLPAGAATSFEGGNLNLSGSWNNGLPAAANPGTIAVDGSNGTTAFNFGTGSVVDQTAGTISSADGFNLTGGTWNLSGGKILCRYFLSNGSSTFVHLTGGTIELAVASSTQYVGVANGGTLTIAGSATIDETQATEPGPTGGLIDISSGWTGSWARDGYSGNDWKNLFTADPNIKLDGSPIDSATFDATFLVSNDGKTLEVVASHPVARNPVPADAALDVAASITLGWTPPTAYTPTGYHVYFGTNPDVRANPQFAVPSNSFDPPGDLAWTSTYHWVVDSLDGTTTHAGTPWSFTTERDPAAPYDPLYDLALHNVKWTSPSTDSAGSMPLGNGDLGMNVWAEPDGDLLLLLSKTDAWSDNGRILKLGRVRISMDPNPFAAGEPFVQTLNLPNGEILITAGPPGDTVELRVWADANHPAIRVEAEGDNLRTWQAEVEIWRTTARNFVDSGELNSAYGVRYGPTAPVIQPDTVIGGQTDRVTWYHRNSHSIWGDTLSVQSLSHLAGSLTDPLLDRTFGATLYADSGFSNTTDTTLTSDTPRTDANFTIVALTEITPTAADWLTNLEAGKTAVEATTLAQRYAAHTDWWQAFWLRHWLAVTDSGNSVVPGSDPFKVTQGYLLQRFINACGGRGGSPIKYNGSIFTVDATAAYDPDYRKWGPCFWWQNTRLPYWAMPMAGDFELMEPLFEMYLDALPLARERVQTYYGHAGAYFPEVIYFWGTWNNDNYGWDRSGKEVGLSDNQFIRWEWQSGLELLWMMLARYRANPDADFATNTLVPLAGDIIDLYDHRFPRDPDGSLRLTPAQALETYWEDSQNPTPEIAGLMSVLGGLLELPGALTTPTRRSQWTRLLGELPPLPLRDRSGQQAISPADILGPKNNHESPELYPVFPYDLYHVGKPDLALADWTYQTRADHNSFGWGQDAIFAAMLGRSSEAKSEVITRFGSKHSGSRFPAMWGPNHDWIPDQCHGGATMVALQRMLLLEDGDRLLLFPAWPADWDLDFRVHAAGDTTLEGRLEGGQLVSLEVSPPARYQDVETYLGTLPPQVGTWEHWRLNTPGAGGGVHDDGDNDGFEDLMEYALGGDPADPTTPEGLVIEPDGAGIVVRYERPTGLIDVSYTLESSEDLAPDGWEDETVVPTVTPSDPDHEWVRYDFPTAGARQFHRLRVDLLSSP